MSSAGLFIHLSINNHVNVISLKTNEPILLQIGTSRLRGKEMKW